MVHGVMGSTCIFDLIYSFFMSSVFLLYNDFISLVSTLHDIQSLLQSVGATTLHVVILCLCIAADGIEVVNGCSFVTNSNAQHGCAGRSIRSDVCTDKLTQ